MDETTPILVVWDSQTPHRYAAYLTEILQVEGFNWFAVHDLARQALTPQVLAGHAVTILTHVEPPQEVEAVLLDHVRRGGSLIALRPAERLAAALGLTPFGRDIVGRYLSLNRGCALNAGVPLDGTAPADLAGAPGEVAPVTGATALQFHGRAELYTWSGDPAHVLAWFEGLKGVPTSHPAIAIGSLGLGRWAVFAYDLAESTVLFHQGRREQASTGPYADADGDRMYKPNDLFVGALDPQLVHLPQADLHQDILVRILDWLAAVDRPLPRLWHFPAGARAVAFINGDGDSMSADDLASTVATCARFGAPYTAYLMMEDHPKVDPSWAAALRAQGHDFGQHPWAGPRPSLAEMQDRLRQEMGAFHRRYGHPPLTTRGHSLIWVGWVDSAIYLRENGVRLDTNFAAARTFRHGYLNGSGLPVKFVDEAGTAIDLYEQATMSTDDGWMTDKLFGPALDVAACIRHSRQQIDAAADRYHTVYQPYFHPLATRPGPRSSQRWLEAVLAHCRDRGLPFVSGAQWLAFNDGRRGLRLTDCRFDRAPATLELTLQAGPAVAGASLILPFVWRGRALAEAAVDGERLATTAQDLEGRRQVLLTADYAAGQARHWRVCWGTPPGASRPRP